MSVEPAIVGAVIPYGNSDLTVAASCGENQGQWYCVDHEQAFANNMMKDGHIARGTHTLAWVCFMHGPESP